MCYIFAREFVEKESVFSLFDEQLRCLFIQLTVLGLQWMLWAKELVMFVPVWLTASRWAIFLLFNLFIVVYRI